jgi:hypothetical protein
MLEGGKSNITMAAFRGSLYESIMWVLFGERRRKQRVRNQKRKLSVIVKNNLAIDVKRLPAEVWMTGPGLDVIVKNNVLAS